MYINHSNLEIEISNMTNALVMINTEMQRRIDSKQWAKPEELVKDDELWEWNVDLLNEMMDFIKKEYPEEKFSDPESSYMKLMKQVGVFFNNLNILGNKGKFIPPK